MQPDDDAMELTGPLGRCHLCLEVTHLTLAEHRPDPERPDGPWMEMRYCARCCSRDTLRSKLNEELNPRP